MNYRNITGLWYTALLSIYILYVYSFMLNTNSNYFVNTIPLLTLTNKWLGLRLFFYTCLVNFHTSIHTQACASFQIVFTNNYTNSNCLCIAITQVKLVKNSFIVCMGVVHEYCSYTIYPARVYVYKIHLSFKNEYKQFAFKNYVYV